MITHQIELISPENTVATRQSSVGGRAILAQDQSHPRCRICDALMTLFFQWDMISEFELPISSNSHLLVFMCPTHNDIVPSGSEIAEEGRMPANYWDLNDGHYRLILNAPAHAELVDNVDSEIRRFRSSFAENQRL